MALADTDTSRAAASGGHKPMTRAEAARHASLVRWKKESPYAANVMERLAEIRAKRAAKGKKKGGKGKGGKGKAAKPAKQTPEQRKQAKEQEEAGNREKAYHEAGLDEDSAGALDDLAQNGTADDDGGLVKLGLAEQADDGSYRLTAAGHAARNAASRGDTAGMKEAISRAKDKVGKGAERDKAKAEREKARTERTAAREERKKAKGGGGKGKPAEKEKPTSPDQREKERQQDRVAQQADRAQRNKEHAEDRARQAQERTTREKERLADRAQRQKEHAEDRAQRNKDRADRDTERKRRESERSAVGKRKQRQEVEQEVARIAAARSRKGIDMDELQPIIDDMQGVIGELTEVAGEALVEVKAGRRNNQSDQATINQGYELAMQLCDLFESLGADTGEEDGEEGDTDMEDEEESDSSMMKAISDNPVAYAYQECNGIQQATAALQMLAQLAASEAAEQDDDTPAILSKLRQAMQILTDFIDGEIGEIKGVRVNQAAIDLLRSWRDGGGYPEMWDALVEADPGAFTFKAIGKREDVSPADKDRAVGEYGDVAFADEKNKKYPLSDEEKIRSAWSYINQEKNAAKYEDSEVEQIKKRIIAAWRSAIDKAGPPSAVEAKKDADLSSLKGIEFVDVGGEEIAVLPGYSVKAIGDAGIVGGYLVKFGGDGDLSRWRDVFTKDTDFGSHRKTDVYVHHRMLPGLGKRRLTNQAELEVDDVGVFMKHLLNMRDPYERALYGLVQKDKLGFSSGTAPHLVERKSIEGGKHIVCHWPIGLDGSYTPTPAGGFDVNASAMKSLFDEAGIDLLNVIYEEEVKSTTDDRARSMLLELDLLELEATLTEA